MDMRQILRKNELEANIEKDGFEAILRENHEWT